MPGLRNDTPLLPPAAPSGRAFSLAWRLKAAGAIIVLGCAGGAWYAGATHGPDTPQKQLPSLALETGSPVARDTDAVSLSSDLMQVLQSVEEWYQNRRGSMHSGADRHDLISLQQQRRRLEAALLAFANASVLSPERQSVLAAVMQDLQKGQSDRAYRRISHLVTAATLDQEPAPMQPALPDDSAPPARMVSSDLFDPMAPMDSSDSIIEIDPTIPEELRTALLDQAEDPELWNRYATIQLDRGQIGPARSALHLVLQQAQQDQDKALEAVAATNLGLAALMAEEPKRAEAWLQRALSQAQAVGEPARATAALAASHLGHLAAGQGNTAMARRYHAQARQIWQDLSDPLGLLQEEHALARLEAAEGAIESAIDSLHHVLKGTRRLQRQAAAQAETDRKTDTALSVRPSRTPIKLEAMAQADLGLLLLQQGSPQAALALLPEAIETFEALDDQPDTIPLWLALGEAYQAQGKLEAAEAAVQSAVQAARTAPSKGGLQRSLEAMTTIQIKQGKQTQAIVSAQEWVNVAEQSNDRAGLAQGLLRLGFLKEETDRPGAERAYRRVLALSPALEHPSLQGKALLGLAHLRQQANDLEEAAALYQQALTLDDANEKGHIKSVAAAGLARLAQERGDLDQAQAHWQRIAQASDQQAILSLVAEAQGALGLIHDQKDQTAEAIAAYETAIALADSEAMKAQPRPIRLNMRASWLSALGVLYHRRGMLDQAITLYQGALELHRSMGDKLGIATDLGNIALIHQARGDLDQAENATRQALQLDEALGREIGIADNFARLGVIAQLRGDTKAARRWYHQAIEKDRVLGRIDSIIAHRTNLGLLALAAEQWPEAEQQLTLARQALGQHQAPGQTHNRLGLARILADLGVAQIAQGKRGAACAQWEEAYFLFQDMGIIDQAARVDKARDESRCQALASSRAEG